MHYLIRTVGAVLVAGGLFVAWIGWKTIGQVELSPDAFTYVSAAMIVAGIVVYALGEIVAELRRLRMAIDGRRTL